MITKPMDVLEKYEIRKSKRQKTAFLTAATAYAQSQRYTARVDKGHFGVRNLVIGNPDTAKYLITAHYDTCVWMPFPNFITPCNFLVYLVYQLLITAVIFAVAFLLGCATAYIINLDALVPLSVVYMCILMALLVFGPANRHTANDNTSGVVTVLEIMQSMPENLRDNVCFVLFDLEEAGLLGSASYRRLHKQQTQNQIVFNLDCVGDGDEIVIFPSADLRKRPGMMAFLDKISQQCGKKKLCLHKKGFAFCPSDQMNFPLSVGIMAFHRKKFLGIYCSRIHTHRDTILEQTNVNILRAAIISMIGSGVK